MKPTLLDPEEAALVRSIADRMGPMLDGVCLDCGLAVLDYLVAGVIAVVPAEHREQALAEHVSAVRYLLPQLLAQIEWIRQQEEMARLHPDPLQKPN